MWRLSSTAAQGGPDSGLRHLQRKSLERLCNGLVIPYRQGGSYTYQLRLVEVPAGQIIRSASEFTLLRFG